MDGEVPVPKTTRQSFIPGVLPTDLMVPTCHQCGGLNASRSDLKLRPHRNIVGCQERCSKCLGCPWEDITGRPSQAAPGTSPLCWSTEVQVWWTSIEKDQTAAVGKGRGTEKMQNRYLQWFISSWDRCTISNKKKKGEESAPRSAVAWSPPHLAHGTESKSCLERVLQFRVNFHSHQKSSE